MEKNSVNCPQCGAPLSAGATECKYCGEKIAVAPPAQQFPQQTVAPGYPAQQPVQQVIYVQQQGGIDPNWPIKSKIVAGILALFFGGIGIHKFYLGQIGMGILYILFCWTFIPAFVAFIEALVYFFSNDYNFQIKNRVRLQ